MLKRSCFKINFRPLHFGFIVFYSWGYFMTDEIKNQEVEQQTPEPTPEPTPELKPVIDDYKAPKRERIHKELKKVSNFTEDEMAIMGWSSLYKAHSLIVKYGQTGVEESFRKLAWFNEAVAEFQKKGGQKSDDEIKIENEKKLTKEERKVLKEKQQEERKAEKEKRNLEKNEERERRGRVKKLKEQFKGIEFRITEFYGFLKELAQSNDKSFELKLLDKTLIQVNKNAKLYMNIFVKEGRITYKRGEI